MKQLILSASRSLTKERHERDGNLRRWRNSAQAAHYKARGLMQADIIRYINSSAIRPYHMGKRLKWLAKMQGRGFQQAASAGESVACAPRLREWRHELPENIYSCRRRCGGGAGLPVLRLDWRDDSRYRAGDVGVAALQPHDASAQARRQPAHRPCR